ncbi:MAG: ribosome recycling factor [Bacilli bacterium]
MEQIALETKERVQKCIESLKENFNTLRMSRANASLLDKIFCDYYGSPTPINQISSISVQEGRILLVKPFDKDDLKAIYAAIAGSDLNLNPSNDGVQVKIVLPPLTEDKRKELAKKAKFFGDDAKVAVRNVRRDVMDDLKKSDEYSDDLKKRIENDIQKVIEETNKTIDALCVEKEKDILSI